MVIVGALLMTLAHCTCYDLVSCSRGQEGKVKVK